VTTTLLLRIAAVVSLLFAAGHTLGGLKKWSPMGDNEVLNAMTNTRFDIMGTSRSYLDFYLAFGWSLSIWLVLQSALLWQMASLARSNANQIRPMIAAFGLATLANGIITWQLILPLPAILSAVLVTVLAAGFVTAKRRQF
jgi:hypothetical protein